MQFGFVIAGVQKAGTSTLYGLLQAHPQIARTVRKELHFFDKDDPDWDAPDYAAYHRFIRPSPSAVIAGDATPMYLFWPRAMERIYRYNPDIRVIVSFRDPIERAYSQWCMNVRRPRPTPAFGVAIRANCPATIPSTVGGGRKRYESESYVARGYYAQQVRRALTIFPSDQMLFLDFHRMVLDLPGALDRMTNFLGLERFTAIPARAHLRARQTEVDGDPPTAADVAMLADVFAADLADMPSLTGVNVEHWPTCQVIAGSLSAESFARQLSAGATDESLLG